MLSCRMTDYLEYKVVELTEDGIHLTENMTNGDSSA